MSAFYRIKGLPGLDGLVVETEATDTNLLEVKTLINPNAMLGDRTTKFPMPPAALYIDWAFVEPIQDPSKEFSAKSPFGEYLYEGRWAKDLLEITYTVYDNALTVSIAERYPGSAKTIYSQNFFASRVAALETIIETLGGQRDQDDLVFALKDIKNQEA